jgi:hypothetical protein
MPLPGRKTSWSSYLSVFAAAREYAQGAGSALAARGPRGKERRPHTPLHERSWHLPCQLMHCTLASRVAGCNKWCASKQFLSLGGPQPQVLLEFGELKAIVAGLEPGQQIPLRAGAPSMFHFLQGTGWMTVDGERFALARA